MDKCLRFLDNGLLEPVTTYISLRYEGKFEIKFYDIKTTGKWLTFDCNRCILRRIDPKFVAEFRDKCTKIYDYSCVKKVKDFRVVFYGNGTSLINCEPAYKKSRKLGGFRSETLVDTLKEFASHPLEHISQLLKNTWEGLTSSTMRMGGVVIGSIFEILARHIPLGLCKALAIWFTDMIAFLLDVLS